MTGTPLLDVAGLTVERTGRLVLDDVTFDLRVGEVIAVVGPNAAGKSTLLLALLGLLPSRGRIERVGRMAFVPQHGPPHAEFPVTALDVALQGAAPPRPFRRVRPDQRAVALQALERVGLGQQAGASFGVLSGGQRQRVLLARALAQQAEMLLLDEPLSAVDAPSEQAILDAIDGERRRGVGVLLATHDLDLARTFADRVLLLAGRVCAFGTPEEALSAEHLRRAYSGRLLVLDESGLAVADDHCHGHDHDQ